VTKSQLQAHRECSASRRVSFSGPNRADPPGAAKDRDVLVWLLFERREFFDDVILDDRFTIDVGAHDHFSTRQLTLAVGC